MTREELEAYWSDPRNRKWGFYYCKADPRIIVPKRFKWMGWAINYARPSAILVVLVFLAIGFVPSLIVRDLGAGDGVVSITAAASVALVVVLCANLSSSKRWSD